MTNDGIAPTPPLSRKWLAQTITAALLAGAAFVATHLGVTLTPLEIGGIVTIGGSAAGFAFHEEETFLVKALAWVRAHHL